jgi:hypothetical protein
VATVDERGGTIGHLSTRQGASGALFIDVHVRVEDPAAGAGLTAALADMDGVTVRESVAVGD